MKAALGPVWQPGKSERTCLPVQGSLDWVQWEQEEGIFHPEFFF